MEKAVLHQGHPSAGETYERSDCRAFLRLTGGGAGDSDSLHPYAENTRKDRFCYRHHLLAATANSPACIPSPLPSLITAKRDLPTAQASPARVAGTHVTGPARCSYLSHPS